MQFGSVGSAPGNAAPCVIAACATIALAICHKPITRELLRAFTI